MAERNYKITISYKNKSKSNPIAGQDKSSDTEQGKGLLTKEGAKTFGAAMVAYGTLKSFATQIINHEVSQVELETGSREMQERASFKNEMVQKGVGLLEMAVTGAMFGGVGAVVGLAIGTTHTLLGYVQKQDTIELKRTIENQTISQNFIRAGAKGSRTL